MNREYNNMKKAERNAKKNKKQLNYRCQEIECCYTCKHSVIGWWENLPECKLINPAIDMWAVETIMPLCICDKYDKKS
jgi:hypothetical protein